MKKNTIATFVLLFLSQYLLAQNLDKYIDQQQAVSYQKIYLHTDRDFYFYGDTLWFAAYLVDGQTHQPSAENCNLYVELINTKGEITQKDIFPIENGTCPGFLSFASNDFKEGNYLLRAYTDYLKNFSDDSFFEKSIKLSDTKNSGEASKESFSGLNSSEIDIQFFPEGGFILADKRNLIAFKAINEKGEPVEIDGRIRDEYGEFVCTLNSFYKGMGTFHLTPGKNSSYKVEIDSHPELNLKFPKVKTEGAKVIIAKADQKLVWFKVITNEKKPKKPFFIVLMHRGKETYVLEIDETQINKNIQVKTDSLKEGINRIVLLNSNLEPLSERLIFVNKEIDTNLKVKLNQEQFKTREKVNIQINSGSRKEYANLSVAIVNENALDAEGGTQNIKSYLLIDSELNGTIPSPTDFLINNETFTSQTKLDLLMLTNGWKNYIWNNLKIEENSLQFQPQLGVTLKGKVLNQFGKKTVDNAKIILNVKSRSSSDIYTTTPDKKGSYEFSNISVYDTASVFLQGKNKKNKNKTWIELDSFNYSAPINPEKTKLLKSYSAIPLSFYRLNYFNNRSLREFYPDYNTRVVEEVVVKADKPEVDDGHHRIYAKPKASFEIKETDVSYPNVFEYIRIKVAGVFIRKVNKGYIITMRGPNGAPVLYLLNGMQTNYSGIADLQMASVDKIEFLKGNEAAIYGVRGAGGVLSVWLKKGEIRDPSSIIVPGTIVKKIKGFASYREFYSPKYTAHNIESEAPDVRTTLYWNPKVSLKNGKAKISFFTCDNIARYRIFVEGITENGKICLGSGEFEVDRRRDKQNEL